MSERVNDEVIEGGAEASDLESVAVVEVNEQVTPVDAQEAVAAAGEPVPVAVVDAEEVDPSAELSDVLTAEELGSPSIGDTLEGITEKDIEELNSLDMGPIPDPEAAVKIVANKEAVDVDGLAVRMAKYAQARAIGATRVKLFKFEQVREAMQKSLTNFVQQKGESGLEGLKVFGKALDGIWRFRRAPAATEEAKKQRKSLMGILDSFKPVKGIVEKSEKKLAEIEKKMAGELDGILKANEIVFNAIRDFDASGNAEEDAAKFKEMVNRRLEEAGVPDQLHETPEKTKKFYGNIFYKALRERELKRGDKRKMAVLRAAVAELHPEKLAQQK